MFTIQAFQDVTDARTMEETNIRETRTAYNYESSNLVCKLTCDSIYFYFIFQTQIK